MEELGAWMPWAAEEPKTVGERAELLRRFRGGFDRDEDYVYGIFERDESAVVGGTGLHRRAGQDAFEIGYWIRTGRAGRGFATEATAALTRVAFELCEVDRVEVRVDPENVRSRAIPRRLGFLEEATLRRRLVHPGPELRDVVVYSAFRDTFPGTPASSAEIVSYDVQGARIG